MTEDYDDHYDADEWREVNAFWHGLKWGAGISSVMWGLVFYVAY